MNDSDDEHRRMGQRRSLGGAAARRARPDNQPRNHRSFRRSVAARSAPVPWRHGAEQAAFPRSHPVFGRYRSVDRKLGKAGQLRRFIAVYAEKTFKWTADKQPHYTEWIAWAKQQADRVDPFVSEKPVSLLDRKHELRGW
jgi:hypothetical protein